MTWLLWRQHRVQVIVSGAVIAVFGVAVVLTGLRMADLYAASKAACPPGQACFSGGLLDRYTAMVDTVHLTLLLPILLGALVAAPLVAREAEQRTNALAWTQAVTRCRWMVTKTAAVVGGGLALATIVSVMVTWWSSTPNAVEGNRFQGAQFDTQNLAPVAFALFAIGLGLFVGAVLRRTLPAVATTVGVYVAARMAVGVFLRPHWMAPVTAQAAASQEPGVPKGSWVLSQNLVDAEGRRAEGRIELPRSCDAAGRGVERCLDRLGYHIDVRYHPASHYWSFQLFESALFGGLGLVLVVGAVLWTLRHDA